MVSCVVCNHEHRFDIESALADASATYGESLPGDVLRGIAEEYSISLNDLKVHMLMHMQTTSATDRPKRNCKSKEDDYYTMGVGDDAADDSDTEPLSKVADYCDESEALLLHNDGTVSLSKQMKLREADMLLAVANEYFKTLQTVGRHINSLSSKAADGEIDPDVAFTRLITKPIVDLYIGTGEQIRSTIKTIADVNQIINGDNNNGANAGLVALAEALKASSATAPNVLNFTNVNPDGSEKNSTQFIVPAASKSDESSDAYASADCGGDPV